jgi:hypothetical protein
VVLGLELFDHGRVVLVVYPALAAVAVDVHKLVDAERVLLVEGNLVEAPDRGGGL